MPPFERPARKAGKRKDQEPWPLGKGTQSKLRRFLCTFGLRHNVTGEPDYAWLMAGTQLGSGHTVPQVRDYVQQVLQVPEPNCSPAAEDVVAGGLEADKAAQAAEALQKHCQAVGRPSRS